MQRLSIVLLIAGSLIGASGCATKKFVRGEVKTSADVLSGRIDSNEGEIGEVRDSVDRVGQNVDKVGQRVTGVEGQVTDLNTGVTTLKRDVQTADQKAAQAQTAAERANGEVVMLDQRFQNRNLFVVADEKSVPFKFDSATLEPSFQATLDEIADALTKNADAIVVLEGRTDSTGNRDYNVRLGERRVEAVRRYLAVDKGVPVYKIHQISLGAAKPVAENKTRDGREKNRAVTMTILVPKADSVAQRNND
jgi:outer membrane protein OmpA-like peptidoglycan-associated protein